jgi:hypothetical protein
MEWQPIETAPEDVPIICIFECNTIIVGRAWRYDAEEPTYDENDEMTDWGCSAAEEFAISWAGGEIIDVISKMPTHWMPLPLPPRATA